MSLYATAPASIAHVLDNGGRLYYVGFRRTLGFAAVASALPAALNTYRLLAPLPSTHLPSLSQIGTLLPWLLMVIMVQTLMLLAILQQFEVLGRGVAGDWRVALRRALHYWPTTLLAAAGYLVAMLVGTVLLVVPGIIISVSLCLFGVVVLVERQRPLAALLRSYHLIEGHWWRTLVVLSVPGSILGALAMGAAAISSVMGATLGVGGQVLVQLLLAVPHALVLPLFSAVMIAHYHDLNLRKEGYDLDARLAAPAWG